MYVIFQILAEEKERKKEKEEKNKGQLTIWPPKSLPFVKQNTTIKNRCKCIKNTCKVHF
jgi:hypothetical protein